MQKLFLMFCLAAIAVFFASGCSRTVGGPRIWWDDRNQARLDDGYRLPEDPGAAADYGVERHSMASGEDLSEDDLRDYRTNLDQEEERRKSESSLLDF